MRFRNSRNYDSQRSQTLRALVAAALAGGLAVTSASAQSMGGFGRRSGGPSAGHQQQQQTGGSSSSSDNSRNAPSSQPAPPQNMPPRVNITPPPAPTRVAPPSQYIPVPGPPRQYTPPPQQSMPVTPPVYNNNVGNNNGGNGFGQSNGNVRRNGGAIAPGAVINNNGNPPMGTGATQNGYTTDPSRGANNGGQNNFWRQGGSNRNDSNSNNSTARNGRGGGRNGGSSTETKRPYNPLLDMAEESYRRLHPESSQPIRVTTPQGQRDWDQNWNDDRHHHHDNYVYGGGGTTIITNGPVLLGGYYYGNYTSYGYGDIIYPSVYTIYGGFPQYICNPSVIVLSQPYYPVYTTPYLPFYQPSYQVTYNQTNYYTTSEDRASDIREGGETAKAAVKSAYTDGTYQAAFADIAKAWSSGNIATLRKHLRDDDTKVSILLKRKYAYSIASGDFEQITRDALDRLSTVSFKFTRLRKAKNGDVTAYGKHIYRTSDDATSGDTAVKDTDTVPFDSDQPYDQAGDPAPGEEKVVYVAYTLRHKDDLWYIIAVNSSPNPLVTSDDEQNSSEQ